MSIKKRHFVAAVILAAGSGARMGSDTTKQKMMVCGESVLKRCVRAFEETEAVDSIVVVCREDERAFVKGETAIFEKVNAIVSGGNTRAESARIGFSSIPFEADFVAIHDAARCLITPKMIEKIVEEAFDFGAATAAKKVSDSVKRVDLNGAILESVPREDLYAAQTPQIFKVEDYARGLAETSCDATITDDNMVVERIGVKVRCVDSGEINLKITTPEDIDYAEFILRRRGEDA